MKRGRKGEREKGGGRERHRKWREKRVGKESYREQKKVGWEELRGE